MSQAYPTDDELSDRSYTVHLRPVIPPERTVSLSLGVVVLSVARIMGAGRLALCIIGRCLCVSSQSPSLLLARPTGARSDGKDDIGLW